MLARTVKQVTGRHDADGRDDVLRVIQPEARNPQQVQLGIRT
jgi:hypothetical protein